MAATLSLFLSLDPHSHHHYFHFRNYQSFPSTYPLPSIRTSVQTLPRFNHSHFKSSFSHSSPPPPVPPSSTATATSTDTGTASSPASLDDPFKTRNFLTNEDYEKLKFLEGFVYYQELESGYLGVRVMRADEMDKTVQLLAESFAVSMLLPAGYVSLLRFLVKQYMIERRSAMPHAATLVGFYRGKGRSETGEEEERELAGTVEVVFDKRGANTSPPTPTPPKNAPYICNMTVKEHLRRRRIGWHLLKAAEELISQTSSSKQVYLHCRMIDEGPFNMYTRAGYNVVKTDGIFILLTLQRRKHLMCKELPVVESSPNTDECNFEEEEGKHISDVKES